jgi:predicted AAA+ superfamily ATPase
MEDPMPETMPVPEGLTFEKVWAAFMENREQLKEIGRYHRESSEELKLLHKNLAAQVDRVSRNVGGINNSLGELIETLIAARLWEKFEGYHYNLRRAYQQVPLYDENNQIRTDIDILLADSEWVMAVEVKLKLNQKDEVDRHVKRMGLIRKYPPAETVGKKLLGAMAGGVVDPDVKDYAYQAGFFVLELAGESARLLPPPEGFEPQKW